MLISTICAAALLSAAHADTADEAATEPVPPSLEFTLTPGVYFPRLDGTSSLGSSQGDGTELDLDSDLGLGGMEPTFNAELRIRNGDEWSLLLGGFEFSTDADSSFNGNATFGKIDLKTGTPYRSTFKLTTVSGEVIVPVWRPYRDVPDFDLCFSPLAGLRFLDMEQELQVPGVAKARASGRWFSLMIGLEVQIEIDTDRFTRWLRRVTFETAVSAGPGWGDGGTGQWMWNVRTGVNIDLTKNLGISLGYRLVEFNIDNNDDYKINAGLQGLFIGGRLRF
jgi:hypothetical protein